MSLPANLFIDTPEMEDSSLQQLSNDADSWAEDIIQKVKERVPSCKNLNMMVKFQKKDVENGTATGSVTIHSADKAVVIPVIIKDFMMSPMDVMIAKGKLVPLTPDYFMSVFSDNKVFDKLEEFPTFGGLGRFEDASLWNAIYPPSLGRYAYASAGYPILDEISDGIDGSSLKSYLTNPKHDKTAARLLSGPHSEVVVKVANLQPVNMNEFRRGVENLIPRSILMLKNDGPNKYSLLSNADKVYHPSIVKDLTRSQVSEVLSTLSSHVEDDINDVDMNGEKLLMLPEGKDAVHLAKSDSEVPTEANEYGHYSVKNKNGVSIVGVVMTKVIDFNMKPVPMKLFAGKTAANYQEHIWGVRLTNSSFRPQTSTPGVGQTGCFVYQPDKHHALCTVPVTIESVVEDGGLHLRAVDMTGAPLRLRMYSGSGMASELQRIAPLGPREYSIPARMKWLALENFEDITNSAESYAVKQASEKLTDKPVHLISTGYNMYSVRGLGKYAEATGWDPTNLQRYQATFLLASLGCGREKIAQAYKTASDRGLAELHGLTFTPLAEEKIAQAKPLAGHLYKIALSLRSNLIKEASYLENSQTVDALLALNFITPQNIAKFISKIPALKNAISQVASCLVGSRLGIRDIPEHSASGAMMRLVEVVDGLEKLKAAQTVGV
jgi:hypothetical protein